VTQITSGPVLPWKEEIWRLKVPHAVVILFAASCGHTVYRRRYDAAWHWLLFLLLYRTWQKLYIVDGKHQKKVFFWRKSLSLVAGKANPTAHKARPGLAGRRAQCTRAHRRLKLSNKPQSEEETRRCEEWKKEERIQLGRMCFMREVWINHTDNWDARRQAD